ncbi:MAG: SAM-dependent methyltransferase, partial [Micromonosporaceae bacterium]
RRLAVLAPAYLGQRLRLTAVELAPPPDDLPEAVLWQAELPVPASRSGLVIATEWLDNVPLDIATVDEGGALRYLLVDPETGTEHLGEPVAAEDAEWAARWWGGPQPAPGLRVELGGPRDAAWARAVGVLQAGLAITVDYGHLWYARPVLGSLASYADGRAVSPIPDGTRDLTVHVAMDAVCAAGEAVAGRPAVLTTQRDALHALGFDGTRPPLSLASTDPAGYLRALSAATQAAELTDVEGLGGHYWLIQPVGIDLTALPAGLRA